mmetsp:Transcript_28298/g.45627  ORF Transcript_28298/g.45627 Transcript_28298/m.45627 type:complete len:256 (+) Transcript_28298:652-1419(+)
MPGARSGCGLLRHRQSRPQPSEKPETYHSNPHQAPVDQHKRRSISRCNQLKTDSTCLIVETPFAQSIADFNASSLTWATRIQPPGPPATRQSFSKGLSRSPKPLPLFSRLPTQTQKVNWRFRGSRATQKQKDLLTPEALTGGRARVSGMSGCCSFGGPEIESHSRRIRPPKGAKAGPVKPTFYGPDKGACPMRNVPGEPRSRRALEAEASHRAVQRAPVVPAGDGEAVGGQERAVTKPLELQLSCKELVGTGLIS